jgi:hypothetical protein
MSGTGETPTAADLATLRIQLGRDPFARLLAIETRCPSGHPAVVRVHPLVGSGATTRPFPTLFWLTCPTLDVVLARLESEGWVRRAEAAIAEDAELRAGVAADHEAYVEERWSLLTEAERREIAARGWTESLRSRGIGGVADRTKVKCLHLHWAHHLARGTTLGHWLESCTEPGEHRHRISLSNPYRAR